MRGTPRDPCPPPLPAAAAHNAAQHQTSSGCTLVLARCVIAMFAHQNLGRLTEERQASNIGTRVPVEAGPFRVHGHANAKAGALLGTKACASPRAGGICLHACTGPFFA